MVERDSRRQRRLGFQNWRGWFAAGKLGVLIWLAATLSANAQLRVVTYNTTGPPDAGMEIVLKSIGEETRNGIAKPIDILLLQEQSIPGGVPGANKPSPDTQLFVALLNNIYNDSGITYAMGNRTGSGDSTQTIVYRTQTIQTIQSADQTVLSTSPRQTVRTHVRPVGYDSPGSDFYIYNSHYKASLDTNPPGTNATQRNAEATAIRINSNALPEGTHAIFAGDHNFYYSDSREPAWGTLTAAGAGQANDPLNRVGNWHNASSFADVHTQSPCVSSSTGCGAGGGMDDRFDFQLTTGEFLDGEGLAYIGPVPGVPEMSGLTHSYHAFGNNGSTFNGDINSGSNTVTFPGVTSYTKSQILNALHSVTDHIPVVADYQLPAVMSAIAGSIPASLDLGQAFSLGVTVSNAANVVATIGADELDYSLTTSGWLTGSYLNQMDQALGGGNMHLVGLDTSSIGMHTGTITVTSTSQGVQTTAAVQNGIITIPVSFLVVLPGDYNGNGAVDAADYVLWRETDGQSVAEGTGADGNRDGMIDATDFSIWRTHFGESASGSGAAFAASVPEPSWPVLLLVGACLCGRRATTLRAWTRKS